MTTTSVTPVDTVWHPIRYRSSVFLLLRTSEYAEQEACGPGRVRHSATPQFRFQAGSLENFQETYFLYSHSVAMRYTQPLTEMSTKEFPWRYSAAGAKSWQLCRPSCAECQWMDGNIPSPLLSLHDLLWESFALLVTAVYTTHVCSSIPDNIASHFNQLHVSQRFT
jgi:hypothetical protein